MSNIILEIVGDQLILTWAPNLELLLWILFMGAAATIGRIERSYLVFGAPGNGTATIELGGLYQNITSHGLV